MSSGSLVEFAEIPVIGVDDDELKLSVLVDGKPAKIFIGRRGFASDKIVIDFDEPHPRFGTSFETKYFYMDEPGLLCWGFDGRAFRLEHLI